MCGAGAGAGFVGGIVDGGGNDWNSLDGFGRWCAPIFVGVSGRLWDVSEAKVFGADGRLSGESSSGPTSIARPGVDAGPSGADGRSVNVVGGCGRVSGEFEDCAG